MLKVKAVIYAIIGGMLSWSSYKNDHFSMAISIAAFTICAIGITLLRIGSRKITWDDRGITILKWPAAPKEIEWSELELIRVDHLGYHLRARQKTYKISKKNMPDSLLARIREAMKANKATEST